MGRALRRGRAIAAAAGLLCVSTAHAGEAAGRVEAGPSPCPLRSQHAAGGATTAFLAVSPLLEAVSYGLSVEDAAAPVALALRGAQAAAFARAFTLPAATLVPSITLFRAAEAAPTLDRCVEYRAWAAAAQAAALGTATLGTFLDAAVIGAARQDSGLPPVGILAEDDPVAFALLVGAGQAVVSALTVTLVAILAPPVARQNHGSSLGRGAHELRVVGGIGSIVLAGRW